ncbi:unnamed protein product, partial [Amoebophrya sp. A25]
ATTASGQDDEGEETSSIKSDKMKKNCYALEICTLSKSYSDGQKYANSEVSFSVKPGQIFALLGHNGAGKTTLMRQITAMVPPTSGDAWINGYSVRHHPDQVRKFLAFCPQQNPMWPGYTLREHLQFFLAISRKDVDKVRMERFAARLGLEEKLDTLCSDLSGGMKRRMWTLCALLQGKDSLLVLDEPTSGLDPQARRDVWLLLEEVCREESRACVFSTHYLDEADVLAEEKVILSHGKVVAKGTSAEMKQEFGLGFWLTLQLDAKRMTSTSRSTHGNKTKMRTCSTSEEQSLIQEQAALLLEKAGRHFLQFVTKADAHGCKHLKCLVPLSAARQIPDILDDLKENGSAFGLDPRVTVEKTTLDEVFQAVGEEGEEEELETARRVSQASSGTSVEDVDERVFDSCEQVKAIFLFRVQADARKVVIYCLICVAFLWGLAGTTPRTGNHVLRDAGSLTSSLFLILSLLGGSQLLYSGRLREEREEGRLAHLLIHGVSKTAYTLGSFLFYLLPSLLTMILGFALAAQCLWPPWRHAPTAMSGIYLWVAAIVYAVDATVYGALFGSVGSGVQVLYLMVGTIMPLVLFSAAWNEVKDVQPERDEVVTLDTRIAGIGLFPAGGGDTSLQMSVGKTLAAFQFGLVPLLFPHTDVVVEEKRVEKHFAETETSTSCSKSVVDEDVVLVSRVKKRFETSSKSNGTTSTVVAENWALNGVSFGVHSGEVFGLLGPNGAGKSTMFTLLSGKWDKIGGPTEGDIRILEENVTQCGFADAYRKMAIVPQFDKHLFPYASAQQHLQLYMVVKNVSSRRSSGHHTKTKQDEIIAQILRDVGLNPDNHQPVGEYSGGMMRKLSFALSLITDPQVLLLDEVSGGVDIVSQRLLWKKMSHLKPPRQTIITASHSMAEVEAVCDRVGIMVAGQLQCLGSLSRVKEVHGNVCQLVLH